MDWGTIGTAVLGSGLVSGGVSYLVARRESEDRDKVLALEREKWEHEKGAEDRKRSTQAIVDALELLDEYRRAVDRYDVAIEFEDDDDEDADREAEACAALLDRSLKHAVHISSLNAEEASDLLYEALDAGGTFLTETEDWVESDRTAGRPTADAFQEALIKSQLALHAVLRRI